MGDCQAPRFLRSPVDMQVSGCLRVGQGQGANLGLGPLTLTFRSQTCTYSFQSAEIIQTENRVRAARKMHRLLEFCEVPKMPKQS